MLMGYGVDNIAARLLELKSGLVRRLQALGFHIYGPTHGPNASSITTFGHPTRDLTALHARLTAEGIAVSLRHNREKHPLLRASPHFYNTEEELNRVVEIIRASC